ncbi:MarR family winged helix-turn-helix transcriptional regulator [Weissella kandleri]|uniref:MarR family winged helix-turn-helix transcriptional regulator n=1 Tax=Weissella kandleri TaxID=1616 RepID=UPI00387E8EFC
MTDMNKTTANLINESLNRLCQKAEQQREFLLSPSQDNLTTTQGHILMLLAEQPMQTNAQLADRLNLSRAAVTKAIKSLQHDADDGGYLEAVMDQHDGRVVRFQLTEQGQLHAQDHLRQHQVTLQIYQELLNDYSESEQQVIKSFMEQLVMKLEA